MVFGWLSSARVLYEPAVAVLWLFASSSLCLAQPCRALEQFGTFDASSNLTDRQLAASVRNWFCAQNFISPDAAQSAAAAIGVPDPDISRALGYNPLPGRYAYYDGWKIDYCRDRSLDPASHRRPAIVTRAASVHLQHKAEGCAAAPGLHVWQTFKPDPLTTGFTLSYQGQPQDVPAHLVSFAVTDRRVMKCAPQPPNGLLLNGLLIVECRRANAGVMEAYFQTTVLGNTYRKLSVPFVWWWVPERDRNGQ